MAWTTPKTWATDDPLDASTLNTHIRDNLDYLYSMVPATEFGPGDILNNTNTETTMGTLNVAAGALGTTGACWGQSWFTWAQNSGGAMNYTFRVKLGATTVFAWTYSVSNAAVTSVYMLTFRYVIANMESASAQRALCQIELYGLNAASQTTANVHSGDYVMYNSATENTANLVAFAATVQMASASANAYVHHLGTQLYAPLT